MSVTAVIVLVAVVIAIAAAFYFLRGSRAEPVVSSYGPRPDDPALPLFEGGERPTEDQIARARLGGVRGAPGLGSAPLVGQAAENTPKHIDDGHTA
jgi:hypothetical protein